MHVLSTVHISVHGPVQSPELSLYKPMEASIIGREEEGCPQPGDAYACTALADQCDL